MIEQDKKAFADALSDVLKMYNLEAGKITMRIWWAALCKYDLQTFLNALGGYCAHPDKCRFAPKAGDIVGMIEGNSSDRKDAAIAAFARVLNNVSRYNSVAFDDPAIHYAIQVGFGGNWIDVCDYDGTKFEYQEKRRAFISAYAAYKRGMNYTPYFAGIYELGGEPRDKHIKYIGDNKKAIAVMSGVINSTLMKADYNAIISDKGDVA